jgi:hypothetical protein
MYCTLLVQEYIPITQRWNSELVRSENLNIIRHDRCCGHINLKQTSGDILRPRACLAVRTSRTNDNLLLSNFLNYTGPFSNRPVLPNLDVIWQPVLKPELLNVAV